MYRTQNFRDYGGMVGTPRDLGLTPNVGEPSNYPDALTNGKNVIFVHGFFVSGQADRGWNAQMFKRFFWSGSKAKFIGVAWFSDPYSASYSLAPQYHDAVINAFMISSKLRDFVNGLTGPKTIVAHSLGNMVVSAAIQDWGMQVDQYCMIDGAVAGEAFDGSIAPDLAGMANPNWVTVDANNQPTNTPVYPTSYWASEWYKGFSGDSRANLTWRNRFSNVAAYNFYSSTEDVLSAYTYEGAPLGSVLDVAYTGGAHSWNLQEKLKGLQQNLGLASLGSTYGGWNYNLTDPVSASDPIYYYYSSIFDVRIQLAPNQLPNSQMTASLLDRVPFFDPGYGYNGTDGKRHVDTSVLRGPSWIQQLYDPTQGSATANVYLNQSTLLAKAFPALTQPAGANPIARFNNIGNYDMPRSFAPIWPRPNDPDKRIPIWQRNDVELISYSYTYTMFDQMVSIGSLK